MNTSSRERVRGPGRARPAARGRRFRPESSSGVAPRTFQHVTIAVDAVTATLERAGQPEPVVCADRGRGADCLERSRISAGNFFVRRVVRSSLLLRSVQGAWGSVWERRLRLSSPAGGVCAPPQRRSLLLAALPKDRGAGTHRHDQPAIRQRGRQPESGHRARAWRAGWRHGVLIIPLGHKQPAASSAFLFPARQHSWAPSTSWLCKASSRVPGSGLTGRRANCSMMRRVTDKAATWQTSRRAPLQEFKRSGILEQEAAGARPQGLEHVLVTLERGEDHPRNCAARRLR